MARDAAKDLHHRPKDLCTLEQAAEMAVKCAKIEIGLWDNERKRQEAAARARRSVRGRWRQLRRWARRLVERLNAVEE